MLRDRWGRARERIGLRVITLAAAVLLAAIVVAACGSSGGSGSATADSSSAGSQDGTSTGKKVAAKPLPPPTHTACRSVVYIGDSTSDGEAEAAYVPKKRLRAPARLHKVGVKHVHMEVSGARSIVETFEGIPNAATVARGYEQHGYKGCWIFALGTNDAADLAAGSNVGLKARIHQMMSIVHGQPVLWVNVLTIAGSPQYYEESGMRHWNRDLVAACRTHPNMRVLNWAAEAKHSWFIPDGVHYTTPGYEHRTKIIVKGLVNAFPRRRPPSASCVVRGTKPRARVGA